MLIAKDVVPADHAFKKAYRLLEYCKVDEFTIKETPWTKQYVTFCRNDCRREAKR